MYCEIWKENSISSKPASSLLDYLDTISAGHPDPLSAYLPYISDSKTNLLEPVLNKFMPYVQYQNDSRYIQLWIIFADSTPRPEEIYYFLLHKSIGKRSSLLYVALADIFESYTWYDQAELTYLNGMLLKAEPLDRLTECYSKFKLKTEGKQRYGQQISVEELRSLPSLRRLSKKINVTPDVSPHTTPIVSRYQSRINLSAYKKTPELENLYHSPYDSKVEPQTPGLINGRLPLGII